MTAGCHQRQQFFLPTPGKHRKWSQSIKAIASPPRPIAGAPASVAMITKGGIASASKNLAMEYAKDSIRFNAVAPGIVDTPMHQHDPQAALRSLSPMSSISDPQEIVDAVVFLAEAPHITGEVLNVDGGAHVGKW